MQAIWRQNDSRLQCAQNGYVVVFVDEKTALEAEILTIMCFSVEVLHVLCPCFMLTVNFRRKIALYSSFLPFSLTTQLKCPLSLKGPMPLCEIS